MRIVIGVLCTILWLVYAGQVLSLVNWGWAQRLGLQEKGDPNDISNRLELWTARFDVLWLWTLPTAGVLMLALIAHQKSIPPTRKAEYTRASAPQ